MDLIMKMTSSAKYREQNENAKPKVELLYRSLEQNLEQVKRKLGDSSDIIVQEIVLGKSGQLQSAILYTDGLVDKSVINGSIIDSLLSERFNESIETVTDETEPLPLPLNKHFFQTIGDNRNIHDFETLYNSLLSGETILLFNGYVHGISISTQGWKERSITQPTSQSAVRGPQEGFTETLRTNTAMIRRKINDPNLWLESMQIGRVTKTEVALMYIKGIVKDEIVEEVRNRLERIDIDGILESGYIEELIQDEAYSPFPTINNTERPDIAAAQLLEGRVVILVDGTPFALVVPMLFISFFQTAEDYYHRADISTLLRIIRFVSLFIAMIGPAVYIAVTTFHQELIPTQLLISLAAQREGVPFPAFIEGLMMEVTFEILREAGIRMPKTVGQALSIVGTLVIGQAAVEAGIVSASMVIVVSITAIASFVIPAYGMSISIRMIRFIIMGLAASFGIYGIVVALIALVLHLCTIRSFGIPYLSPFAPFVTGDHKDSIFRLPHWAMKTRPKFISQNHVRQQGSKPSKPRS